MSKLVPVGPGKPPQTDDPGWRQSAATRRAIYRRLLYDPGYLTQVPLKRLLHAGDEGSAA